MSPNYLSICAKNGKSASSVVRPTQARLTSGETEPERLVEPEASPHEVDTLSRKLVQGLLGIVEASTELPGELLLDLGRPSQR